MNAGASGALNKASELNVKRFFRSLSQAAPQKQPWAMLTGRRRSQQVEEETRVGGETDGPSPTQVLHF